MLSSVRSDSWSEPTRTLASRPTVIGALPGRVMVYSTRYRASKASPRRSKANDRLVSDSPIRVRVESPGPARWVTMPVYGTPSVETRRSSER